MSEKALGAVKWYSPVKVYGSIQPDASAEDLFVHCSAIVGEGFRNLERGERVEFAVEESEKGPQATQVIGLGVSSLTEEDRTTGGIELESIPP